MKSFKQEKMFYSIRETAEMFDVNESLLRYWEKEFPSINPAKTNKGTRQYRKEDIDAIRLVYHLVKERGLTLSGAKQKLKENKEEAVNREGIIFRLKGVRDELIALRDEFDEMEKQIPRES